MKKLDVKSLAAGFILGTLGITTVFAATGIQSASLSDTKVTLNGAALPLGQPLISVIMENEESANLYVPANELLEKLGYTVHYDDVENTIDLVDGSGSQEAMDTTAASPEGNIVLQLANHANQKNISESGSFQAKDSQTLILTITSDIKGGSVNLFLFDPSGKEQCITIGSADMTKEIALEKGTWQYNCSGMFKDGGNVTIIGTIQ